MSLTNTPAQTGTNESNTFSILGMVFGVLMGPIGIIFAVIAKKEREPLAKPALIVSIGFTAAGVLLHFGLVLLGVMATTGISVPSVVLGVLAVALVIIGGMAITTRKY